MSRTIHNQTAAPELWGHPRGMAYIVFTEAWERFSFYGMQALLVLYLSTHLLPDNRYEHVWGMASLIDITTSIFGELSTHALATQLFGLYVGFIYAAPIIGGWIGDRITGRNHAVLAGALAMTAGHLLMAVEQFTLVAIVLLIIGSGLLKGNLAAQVGALYGPRDSRRDSAYTLYNVSINIGATIAPLVCGTLGELYGWHYGFGAAGIGMVVGLIVYVRGMRYMPVTPDRHDPSTDDADTEGSHAGTWGAVAFIFMVACLFWSVQAQVWNSYPLWLKDRVDRLIGSFEVPVTWFQSLDAFGVLLFSPVVLILWAWQKRRAREPSDRTKVFIGFVVYAAGFLLLGLGEIFSGEGLVAIIAPISLHLVLGLGFLYVGPIFMSILSRIAPPTAVGTVLGTYYLSLFIGGVVSGWLGRFYEPLGPTQFWLLHAAILLAGALVILLGGRVLNGSAARPEIAQTPHHKAAGSQQSQG